MLEKIPTITLGLRHIATKSILNPLLVFAFLLMVILICITLGAPEFFLPVFFLFTSFCVFFGLCYLYVLFKDPDRLHDSNTYTTLRRQMLLGDSERNPEAEPLTIDSSPISNTANILSDGRAEH